MFYLYVVFDFEFFCGVVVIGNFGVGVGIVGYDGGFVGVFGVFLEGDGVEERVKVYVEDVFFLVGFLFVGRMGV